jgi:hypothetical protein
VTIFWAFGGGLQSRAIAVLIKQGKLPMPDLIGIANTTREVSSTWSFIDEYLRPAGFEVHVISHDYATVDLYRNDDLLIPAYTRQNGSIGKMDTFCSNEWKQRVCRRWLSDRGVTDCDAWLGMSTNEIERMKPSGLNWYRHVYPLIEIVKMSRSQCHALVTGYGWPVAKSRCWMCPNMSVGDWRDLKKDEPENFVKAVEFDDEIRQRDPNVYLHRSALPLAQAVEVTEAQETLFDGCDSGYCMT